MALSPFHFERGC